MTFLQLRITVDPSGTRNADRVGRLLKSFLKNWILVQDPSAVYTGGFERLNKYGEPCDPHYHLNADFDPSDLKDPLRSAKNWLKKQAIASDYHLKGNKVWSCTLVEEPTDHDRWLRYPLKEYPVMDLTNHPNHQNLHYIAFEERKRSVEINILKRQKLADKQSFRDKLFKYLDAKNHESNDNDEEEFTHRTIWLLILKYYTDQGKAVCFKTINGYTLLYMLYIGLMTPEEAYDSASISPSN